LYVNPTTSTRFNPYMPAIIRKFHLRAVGGKGGLDKESVKAMEEVGCVYLSILGAGSPLFSSAIKEVITVAWNDLISHYRLVNLKVERFGPMIVAIDSHGNSTYENISAGIEAKMPGIIKDLTQSNI
jgi:fumarate hydratase subunit beta